MKEEIVEEIAEEIVEEIVTKNGDEYHQQQYWKGVAK